MCVVGGDSDLSEDPGTDVDQWFVEGLQRLGDERCQGMDPEEGSLEGRVVDPGVDEGHETIDNAPDEGQ